MEKTFILFGKQLTIDDAFYTAINLRPFLKEFAKEGANEFIDYYCTVKNFEDLLRHGYDKGFEIESIMAAKCTDKLPVRIPANTILNNSDKFFENEIIKLQEWYSSVLYEEQQKNITRITKGQKASDSDSKAAGRSKLRNKQTCEDLWEALYMDIIDWAYFFETELPKYGIPIRPIGKTGLKLAENLFKTLKAGKSNNTQAQDIAYQIFETNPTANEYYEYCFNKFPEEQKNLIALANYCGIDLSDLYEKQFENIFKAMPHSTEEQTKELKNALTQKQAALGVSKSKTIDKVDKMLLDFDLQARTFRHTVYDTREARKKAEEDYKILSEICQNIETADEAECIRIDAETSAAAYTPQVLEEFSLKIHKRLNEIHYKEAKTAYKELTQKDSKLKLLYFFQSKKTFYIPLTIVIILGIIWLTDTSTAVNAIMDKMSWAVVIGIFVAWSIISVIADTIFEKTASEDAKNIKKRMDDADIELEKIKDRQQKIKEQQKKPRP